MADNESLAQRYADLLDAADADDLLPLIRQLDVAAQPLRQLQPPAAVDQMIARLVAEPPPPSNGRVEESAWPAAPSLPALLPQPGIEWQPQSRRGWLRQGLSLVAAALVLVMVTGLLVVALHSRPHQFSMLPGSASGSPAVATPAALTALPTPDGSDNISGLTLEQAQQQAPFHLVQPGWMAPALRFQGLVSHVASQSRDRGQTGQAQTVLDKVTFSYSGGDRAQGARVEIMERASLPATESYPDGRVSKLVIIAGQVVSRVGLSTPGDANLRYEWDEDGTAFVVTAVTAPGLTEQDVEQMIASLIDQENVPATPPASVAPATSVALPTTPTATPAAPSPASQATFISEHPLIQKVWTAFHPSITFSEESNAPPLALDDLLAQLKAKGYPTDADQIDAAYGHATIAGGPDDYRDKPTWIVTMHLTSPHAEPGGSASIFTYIVDASSDKLMKVMWMS